MKIYVASSWRNQIYQFVVDKLREAGFEVYDFRNPQPGNNGFHWSEIDPNWQNWDFHQYTEALEHPIAKSGFSNDMTALMNADICVLVLPSGRSAHLEAGYAIGAEKPTYIIIPEKMEPELMYKMASGIFLNVEDLIIHLRGKKCWACGEPATKIWHISEPTYYCDECWEYKEDYVEVIDTLCG